jgi:RES domain-containing protein
MKKHPQSEALARGLNRATKHAGPFAAETFRATSVEYSNRDDLLTGLGAKMNGGRWNPPGSFAAVYVSTSAEGAVSEYLAHQRHFGFRDSDALPCTLVGLEVQLKTVLDLTDGEVRKALGVSETRMLDDAWRKAKKHESLTQAIGRLAFEAEFEAILVPSSAAPGVKNLVVFPGNVVPPDGYVKIVNRSKLPLPHSRKD